MVSIIHAEVIQIEDGTFCIRDLDSRRGVYLGSTKVKNAPLRDGDELMIGPTRLRFEAHDAVASTRGTGPVDVEELIRLRAVVALSKVIGVEHDLRSLGERVIATCFELLRADRAAIVIYEPQKKAPFLTIARDQRSGGEPFAVSTSLLGQVMVSHEAYLRTEVDDDQVLQRSESLSADGVRSVMAVPLRYEASEPEWLGVIVVDSRIDAQTFLPRDLELLDAIAGPTALAIKNAMLVKQIETVVDDEWRRLERVVRDLPLGVVVLDDRHVCTLVNRWITNHPMVGKLHVGHAVDAIAGIPCDRLIGADALTYATFGERVLAIGAITSGRETVVVINDITGERERQNREAHRDRVAMIGQLAGGIAHDFNNLLHVILSYATMLEDGLADNATALDDVAQITHAATSAADLTRQLLTFSRRELVTAKVVDVTTVVSGMEKLLVRTLGSQGELAVKLGARIPRILIDTAQLEQILMNLVVNARDAMLGRGRVAVQIDAVELDGPAAAARSVAPGRYVSIEVADAGAGMSPDVVARVFEPYFTTKACGKGTGLGLATVHGIVQLARGDISVHSVVGQGTTFQVLLPATEQAPEGAQVADTPAPSTGTILVVDDDEDVRRVTERILRNAGYTVLSASSSATAVKAAEAHGPEIDLLLTDIVMPGRSGRDLARELVAERPALRVVFMSGYHQQTPIGSSQFIAKPFARADLLDKLRDVLTRERAPTAAH